MSSGELHGLSMLYRDSTRLPSILHVVFCVLCTHRFGFRFTVDLIFESQHVMKSMNKNIKDKDILLPMLSVDIPNWSEHLFILTYKTA